MTDKEKELAERWLECERVAREKKTEAYDVLMELTALAPHKLGEVIRWEEKVRRNIGTWLNPKYEQLPPVEKTAVAVSVRPVVETFNGLNVYYKYEFKDIKKDGGVSKMHAYPRDGYEWTGDIHKDFIDKKS